MNLKTKYFVLFLCFEPISKHSKQTDMFRNKPKQTETTLNFRKNTQMYSLLNCLGGSSVCLGSVELWKLSVLVYTVEEKQPKQTVSKQTEKNEKTEKTLNFLYKIAKYAPFKTVSVGLLFVSVQAKRRNSLFRYKSETTKTNVLFWIVPKLVTVQVSVVSNRN